jgi:hypothetical protein
MENDILAICAKKNLAVTSTDDWKKIETGNQYVTSFYQLDQKIIYTTGETDSKNYCARTFFKYLDQFVNDQGVETPYVLIRDLTNASGMPRSDVRRAQKELMNQRVNQICGCIFISNNVVVKSLVKVASRQYKKLIPIKVTGSVESAIDESLKMSRLPSRLLTDDQNTVQYDSLVFLPQWQYENTGSGFVNKNGIIHEKIWFSSIAGKMSNDDINQLEPGLKKMFQEAGFKQTPYVRIVDLSQLGWASFAVCKKYEDRIKAINEANQTNASVTYVAGANSFIRAWLQLFSRHISRKMYFFKTLAQAFSHLNASQTLVSGKKETVTINRRDVRKLIDVQSRLLFENNFWKKIFFLRIIF